MESPSASERWPAKCSVTGCEQAAVTWLVPVLSRHAVGMRSSCHVHAAEQLQRVKRINLPMEGLSRNVAGAALFDVELLVMYRDSARHEIHLRECGGAKEIALACGYYEIGAIHGLLRGERPIRPLTNDAIVNTIHALGATVQRITIHDREPTQGFYLAIVSLVQGGNAVEVDFRPSDALFVALSVNAPIFIADHLVL